MNRNANSEIENYFNKLEIELSCCDISFSNTEGEPISITKEFFEEIFLAIDDPHQDSNFCIGESYGMQMR